MPSPTLFEWCSTSFSSLRDSVHQRIAGTTKPEIKTPPSLVAIQSLKGKTPGAKFRDLNNVINTLIENAKTRARFAIDKELTKFSPTLIDLIKISFGVKLRIDEFIVEGLKSKDPNVVWKALSADWFFNGMRTNVNVDFFANQIFPFVSLRTRRTIVKKLSQGLKGYEIKAENFFIKLVDLYGLEGNLNLLVACSKDFIWTNVLEHKLILPLKIVNQLYGRYPDIVIRYLELGNKKKIDNSEERKIHRIQIHDYDIFLPKLIRKHCQIFLDLYQLTPEKVLILNKVESKIFLKNCKSAIMEKPHIYLKLIPLKIVQSNLNKEEFETIIENLLPLDINDFDLKEMMNYIENYRQTDGIQLLKDKYKKVYGKNLLDDPRLSSINPEDMKNTERMFKMLPRKDLENRVRLVLNRTYETNQEIHELYLGYLPPNEAIPIFKKKISKISNGTDRIAAIGRMITCCSMYNCREGLLDVLKYYRDKHKNEQNLIFCRFLEILSNEFDLNSLSDNHWGILNELIENSYIKQELFQNYSSLIEFVLESSLHNEMKKQKSNSALIDKLTSITLECKMNNYFLPNSKIKSSNPEIEKKCIEKYFQQIPEKDQQIFEQKVDRLSFVLNIVKTIDKYNKNNPKNKIKIEDYPWILKMAEEFFPKSETGFRKQRLMKFLKINAREFYESKVDEILKIRDIESGEALDLLKRDPEKILENFTEYLSEARGMFHSENRKKRKTARHFIANTKFYQDIPVKIIDKCLNEIKKEGSIQVLGILLPGDYFEKTVEPYAPKDTTIKSKENFEITRSILKSIIYTEPPVNLEFLNPFCKGEFHTLTEGVLMNLIQRINVDVCIEFARKLLNYQKMTVKKQGIRLMQKVSTKSSFREFLKEILLTEESNGLRKVVCNMIFDLFVQSPDSDTWELMKSCIKSLTTDDLHAAEDISDVRKINPIYLSNYIQDYLDKIEELFDASKNVNWRAKCVCLVIESVDEHKLSDEISLKILEKYFFNANSTDISRVVCNFAVRICLLSPNEERMEKFKNIIKNAMKNFDKKLKRFYPWNYTLREFFDSLLREISSEKSDDNLKIINHLIELISSELIPIQEPTSYIALNLYREYLQSESPKDYGIKCARRLSDIIEEFSGHEPIFDVADCLDSFIKYKIFRETTNPMILKISIIEGLMDGGDYYGSLVTTKLLRHDEVKYYDERYDEIVEKLKKMKNASVQCYLHKHLNSITDYDLEF